MISTPEVKVVQNYLEILATLTREKIKIEQRLESVESSLLSILSLHDEEEVMPYLDQLYEITRPEGFTDAVRKVLRSAGEPLTPADVKDRLPNVGFNLASYSNPLASIHTISEAYSQSRAGYAWI